MNLERGRVSKARQGTFTNSPNPRFPTIKGCLHAALPWLAFHDIPCLVTMIGRRDGYVVANKFKVQTHFLACFDIVGRNTNAMQTFQLHDFTQLLYQMLLEGFDATYVPQKTHHHTCTLPIKGDDAQFSYSARTPLTDQRGHQCGSVWTGVWISVDRRTSRQSSFSHPR